MGEALRPPGTLRLATWNVNSLPARLGRIEEWIGAVGPDVCCLQETKVADAAFPFGAFQMLGYEAAHHGDGRWNGVAILSRIGLEDVRPGFVDSPPGTPEECRLISATCRGVRVTSVYVPNGRSVGSEHYEAKLAFLGRLRANLETTAGHDRDLAVCGDFNIAPADIDVYNPAAFVGATHVSPEERSALEAIEALGMVDVFRAQYRDVPNLYSWWDYRGGDFHRGRGMRIDLVLASSPLAARVRFAIIDRNARKGQGTARQPSDHAPLVVDIADGLRS